MTLSSHKPPLALDEALRFWLGGATPVEPERVPLREAVGRVLAEDLRAPADHPPRHVALRDGHAVESAQTIGASSYAPASLLAPPVFVRAGDALPKGADAVLPADAVEVGGPLAQALEEAAPGRDVRRAGEDLRAGDLIARAGDILRDGAAFVCASAGMESAAIRAPRVAVAGAGAGAGADLIASAVVRHGGRVVAEGGAQAVLVLGGEPAGASEAARVALRPGEAIWLARDEAGRPVLHLPDLPGECLAAALVLLPALLRRLSAQDARPGQRAALLERASSSVGMAEIELLAKGDHGVRPLAVGDLPLSALTRADAFAVIGPDSEGVAAGDAVEVFPLW